MPKETRGSNYPYLCRSSWVSPPGGLTLDRRSTASGNQPPTQMTRTAKPHNNHQFKDDPKMQIALLIGYVMGHMW